MSYWYGTHPGHQRLACGCYGTCKCKVEKCGPAGKGTTALSIIGTILGGIGTVGVAGAISEAIGGCVKRKGCEPGIAELYAILSAHGAYGGRSQDCLSAEEVRLLHELSRCYAREEKEKAEKFAIERDEKVYLKLDCEIDKAAEKAQKALDDVRCVQKEIELKEKFRIEREILEKELAKKDAEITRGEIKDARKDSVIGDERVVNALEKFKGEFDTYKAVTDIRIANGEERIYTAIADLRKDTKYSIKSVAKEVNCATKAIWEAIDDIYEDFVRYDSYVDGRKVGHIVGCGFDFEDEDCGGRRVAVASPTINITNKNRATSKSRSSSRARGVGSAVAVAENDD